MTNKLAQYKSDPINWNNSFHLVTFIANFRVVMCSEIWENLFEHIAHIDEKAINFAVYFNKIVFSVKIGVERGLEYFINCSANQAVEYFLFILSEDA